MGQQQLLILVLVFMIGTVALIGATQYLDSVDQQNERDMIVTQIHNLIADAVQYRMSPPSLGGGGGSMENFQPQHNKSDTDRFTITVSGYPTSVVFLGASKSVLGMNNTDMVQVIVTFDSNTQKAVVETIN